MKDDTDDCELIITDKTNYDRGPTDKQTDASPFAEALRLAIEKRVGKATTTAPTPTE